LSVVLLLAIGYFSSKLIGKPKLSNLDPFSIRSEYSDGRLFENLAAQNNIKYLGSSHNAGVNDYSCDLNKLAKLYGKPYDIAQFMSALDFRTQRVLKESNSKIEGKNHSISPEGYIRSFNYSYNRGHRAGIIKIRRIEIPPIIKNEAGKHKYDLSISIYEHNTQ